jgi:hypothetical protein
VVTIRFPRLAWFDWRVRIGDNRTEASTHWRRDTTDVVLSSTLPWRVEFRDGVSSMAADLRAVRLEALELSGGAGNVNVQLGRPVGAVPIRASGGANDITLTRSAGTAVSVSLSGGYHAAVIDGTKTSKGGRITSVGGEKAADRFDIQISGGANRIVVGVA